MDKWAGVIGALVIALLGSPSLSVLSRASRRSRMRARVLTYAAVADGLREAHPQVAADVDELVRTATESWVTAEREAATKRLDPASAFAVLVLGTPLASLAAYAWYQGGVWLLAAIPATAVLLMVVLVGYSQRHAARPPADAPESPG